MRPSPDERARKSDEGLKEVRRSRMGARAGAMAREVRMVVEAAGGEEKKGLSGGGAAGEGFGGSLVRASGRSRSRSSVSGIYLDTSPVGCRRG